MLVADEPGRLAITDGELPSVEAVAEPGAQIVPWAGDRVGRPALAVVASAPAQIPHLLGEVDVVLPVLHGPFGEDGTIQGLLEMAGVPLRRRRRAGQRGQHGQGVHEADLRGQGPAGRARTWWSASGTGADGRRPRAAAAPVRWPTRGAGLRTPERKRVLDDDRRARLAAVRQAGQGRLQHRHVQGARHGRSCTTPSRLARQYDPKVLVEAAIDGGEIEVSVLEGIDGAPPDTSLPGQLLIDGGEEFWDFEAKYLDAASGMAIPAPIPDGAIEEIRRLAAAAFDAVSCEGLARVDFFYTTDGQILINEINTIPGLSPASYFQKMWEASGLPFPQLIDRLLQTALDKRPGLR